MVPAGATVTLARCTEIIQKHSKAEAGDVDGDLGLAFVDFVEVYANFSKELSGDEVMQAAFDLLDMDKDGYLDREQLEAAAVALGLTESIEEVHLRCARITSLTEVMKHIYTSAHPSQLSHARLYNNN
jgi:Ca2+-binding EF-hand superfamily protein